MSSIEKFVSPFIPQQFPAFYKEEGPNFIAFVKAYYEWMESTGQALLHSRSLLEYSDIDSTEAEFLKYFRNTYLSSLPESILSDKRLLVKHILDLYRSKGTPRAYELLFRLIFNEAIEIFIPGNFLFKPSDGNWEIPRYIEVSDSEYLERLIGKQIFNSSRNATAVVESVNRKIVKNKLIHVLYLSSINGRFKFGERILCAFVPEITLDNAPTVIGSLTAIAIENGGAKFSTGDIVDVIGGGVNGKARIAAIRDENGKVTFNLLNGGSGYSTNAIITVATALYLTISNTVSTFIVDDTITSSNTTANGSLKFANSTLLLLTDFSSNTNFFVGDNITNSNGATATVQNIFGGGGSGATFKIGGLVNKEIMSVNTDYIGNRLNTLIATSLNLDITNLNGVFSINDIITSSNTAANGIVTFANTTVIKTTNYSTSINFNIGDIITNIGGASANIVNVSFGATWAFPKNPVANVDSIIADTLFFKTIEAGTIAFLSGINPGTGYSANPFISVIEPDVAAEGAPDSFGGIKGRNAIVDSDVGSSEGVVTAVEVVDSGFGYNPGETIFLSAPFNQGIVITGAAVIDTDGKGDGYWENNNGFLSDIIKIQDSFYYQNFSYDILINRMLSVYEKVVKDLVHPSGIMLFGRFRLKTELISDLSVAEFFSLTQS